MENLMGRKKILILGATSETAKLVITAEQMGIETYVVDPFSDAIAKKYASVSIDHDCFDVDGICAIIEENNIDGVLPGCADILVPVYEEVCRRLKKHCYVNMNIVNTFNNKKGLKEALIRHGMPVIKDFSYNEVKDNDFDMFPLFIKPTDNNSSKGMSIVNNHEQLPEAYLKGLEYSKSKTVLIEEYKETDDFYVGYFIQDGNIGVTFTGDRFVIKQSGVGSITSGIIYPSRYEKLYFSTVHNKMIKLFKELDFNNGICAIQGFVEKDQIMFYDPALRITGGQEYILIDRFTGLDELENLIHFAIYGKMRSDDEYKKCDASFGGKYGCNLTFSVEPCTIGKIKGIDYARDKKQVINITQEHDIGDVIDKKGTAQQNIARMHIMADSANELCDIITDLQQHIQVTDKEGRSVILTGLNPNKWLEAVRNE